MLQPLGISAEAEAVYIVLGPLASASVSDLAKLTAVSQDAVGPAHELQNLGLADRHRSNGRPCPCSRS